MAQKYAATRQAREEAIYLRHAPDVFAYLPRHVPIYQDAEDLLLEVFLIVLEKLPSLTLDEQRLAAYALTIARNKMVDYYRKRDKRQIVPLPARTTAGNKGTQTSTAKPAATIPAACKDRTDLAQLPHLSPLQKRSKFTRTDAPVLEDFMP